MSTYYVLSNPKADSGRGTENAHKLDSILSGHTLIYADVTQINDMKSYISGLPADAAVILCGGDGTLNHFINDIDSKDPGRDIYLFGTGTGNDFMKDIGHEPETEPVLINQYIVDLPTITVNGMTRYFINGIGYGIDGYCCEEGDRIRTKTDKPINYTTIAVKGLLYAYKRVSAEVTVDGVTTKHTKVWLAPSMKGRFFGGGMMCAPTQKRLDPEHKVSVMIMRSVSKLKALVVFPSIFKGNHIRHTEMVTIRQGHDVSVVFDKPTALQIDGETVLNVQEYTVTTRYGSTQKQENKEYAGV
ncbi:MAG: diacylglycerol kinase family protein [Clostridia bacterium]|nr:diacylglycerol kinase family protein [Clostridia bacterium]